MALAHATDVCPDTWNGSLGAKWAVVLRVHGVERHETVVEVGPGFTDKIALALAALGFHGTVALVEPTFSACAWAMRRYQTLLPGVRVVAMPVALARAAPDGDVAVDVLVLNHVLDDMLLRASVSESSAAKLFDGMRPGSTCSVAFVDAWRRIVARRGRVERAITRVADEVAMYVMRHQPRLILLHEYPGWIQQRHGLGIVHELSLRAMVAVEDRLGGLGFTRARVPAPAAAAASTWLVMSRAASRAGASR
jgi:hypothetical protein